ncbi:MAG: PPE domain-containing protein [Eubacteriales bacterium]|nr:PPE domain-containing protein [Eubacteriales bacterium]
MRSENEIRMYYIDTLHKADQLEELAEQLSRIANHTLQEIQDEMTGNWKGAGSGQYLKKHMKMADLAKKHAKKLREAAVQLRSSARRLYNVEMAALAVFRRRRH